MTLLCGWCLTHRCGRPIRPLSCPCQCHPKEKEVNLSDIYDADKRTQSEMLTVLASQIHAPAPPKRDIADIFWGRLTWAGRQRRALQKDADR